MANTGGDALQRRIRENTPVRTGALRESWIRTEATKHENRYESRVQTDVDYAPYVNYGTGLWGPKHMKYLIEPVHAPMLSWIDPKSGKRVYAQRVWHPGSPGAFMLEYGAAKTEAEIEVILLPDLEQMKAEYEALAVKAQVKLP
jgi:hypothetical protein